MLGAGVAAAGDVEVYGLVDREACVEQVGEGNGMLFGIAGGEATTLVAGAGYGAAEHGAGGDVEAGVEDG